MNIFYIVPGVLNSVFWRMGGADGYDKLWRRIGCTFVISSMLLIHSNMNLLEWAITTVMIGWGCWSYFAWLNHIVALWWRGIEHKREYWWNFLASGLLIQGSILVESFSLESLATAFVFALLGAFGKVWIDKDEDGWKTIMFWKVREDVLSELYYGLIMFIGVVVNIHV